MQRPPQLAAVERGIGRLGALQGALGIEHDHGIDRRVQSLDAPQVVLQQFHRAQFAAAQAARQFGGGLKGQVEAHRSFVSRSKCKITRQAPATAQLGRPDA